VRGIEKLYDPRHYGIRNAYPARSIQRAGGILVAGSDAPVDARDPRPFVNMAIAVSRANEDGNVLNRDETISIHDVIAAYTRNGARALRQDTLTGQLRSGYKADIIVTNQNIVELAEAGQIGQVAATQVLTTMFDGRLIFQAF